MKEAKPDRAEGTISGDAPAASARPTRRAAAAERRGAIGNRELIRAAGPDAVTLNAVLAEIVRPARMRKPSTADAVFGLGAAATRAACRDSGDRPCDLASAVKTAGRLGVSCTVSEAQPGREAEPCPVR